MATSGKFQYTQADQVINATTYVKFQFAQAVRSIVIINDGVYGGANIYVSRDGTLINATIEPGDVYELHVSGAPPRWIPDISLKASTTPAPSFRIMSTEG